MSVSVHEPVAWFLTFLAHATLLLALVWLLRDRLERLEPTRRVVALRWALGGALLTATLQRAVTVPALDAAFPAAAPVALESETVPEAARRARALADRALAEARRPFDLPEVDGAAPVGLRSIAPGGAALAGPALDAAGPAAGPAPVQPLLLPIPRLLGSLGGLLLVLGFASAALALLRSVRLERSLGRRHPVDPESALGQQFDRLRHVAGRSSRRAARTRLCTSPTLAVPIAHGWLWPQVVLPLRALEECSAHELEAAMAHELAHVARGDLAWAPFDLLNRCLLSPHPLGRSAARRLEDAQESAADALGAAWTGRPKAMASMLARAAAWVLEARAMHAPKLQSAMAVQRHALTRRVDALLAPEPAAAARFGADRWLPGLACALAFLPPLAPESAATPGDAPEPERVPGAAEPRRARLVESLPNGRASALGSTLPEPTSAEPAPTGSAPAEPDPADLERRALILQVTEELRAEARLLRNDLRNIAILGRERDRVDASERAEWLSLRAEQIEQQLARFAAGLAVPTPPVEPPVEPPAAVGPTPAPESDG